MSALRATVVGGGIGGLTTARALLRAGVDVALYEQAPQLTEVGAGVVLAPNGTRLLRRAGLGPAIESVACHWTTGEVCRADDTVVGPTMGDGTWDYWGFHRADLVDILRAGLPDGMVRTGMRCTGFTQTGREARVTFAGGEEVASDFVVAADGLHSALQQYVVAPAQPRFSGTVAYRGLVSSSAVGWRPRAPRHWVAGGGRHLMTFPVRRGEMVNYVGFMPTDDQGKESWSAQAVASDFADQFTGWNPRLDSVLRGIESAATFRWSLYDRQPLARWTHGRLALLGDAAHPMLPHVGQGANQAIEDAFALAVLVREAGPDQVPAALLAYERLRRERAAAAQESSRRGGEMFKQAGSTFGVAGSGAAPPRPRADPSWIFDYDAEAAALAAAVK